MLKQKITDLVQNQVQCVLATHNEDSVSQHLMAYNFSSSLSDIFFISFSNTHKVKNIRGKNSVSVLWDNRSHNTSDHTNGYSMTGIGHAEIISVQSTLFDKAQFLERNPNLKELINHKDCVCILVKIEKYIFNEGYTSTSILTLD